MNSFFFFSNFSKLTGTEIRICAKLQENLCVWVKTSMQQYSCFSDLMLSRQWREGKKCFLACGHAVYFIVQKRVLLLFLFSSKGYSIWWSTSAFPVIKPNYSEVVSTVDGFSHFLMKICLENPPWYLLFLQYFLI